MYTIHTVCNFRKLISSKRDLFRDCVALTKKAGKIKTNIHYGHEMHVQYRKIWREKIV